MENTIIIKRFRTLANKTIYVRVFSGDGLFVTRFFNLNDALQYAITIANELNLHKININI